MCKYSKVYNIVTNQNRAIVKYMYHIVEINTIFAKKKLRNIIL